MKEIVAHPNDGPIAGSQSEPSGLLVAVVRHLSEQSRHLEGLENALGRIMDRLDGLEEASKTAIAVSRDSRTMQDALVAVGALEKIRTQLQDADAEIDRQRRLRVDDLGRIRALAADRDALEVEIQANAARHRRELLKLNAVPSAPAPPPIRVPAPTVRIPTVSPQPPAELVADTAPFVRRSYQTEMPRFTREGPLDRNRAEALLEQARSVMRTRDWAAAASAYAEYLGYQPARPRPWKQYGHALKEAGDLNGAERAYFRSLTLDPADTDTAIHLAHVLKNQGLCDAAAEILSAILQAEPGSVEARDGLALMGYPEPKTPSVPRPAFRRLSILQKYRFNKDLAAAKHAARSRDWARAAELYGQLSARQPADAGLVIRRGHALKELGRVEDAAEAYRQALVLEPLSSDAHLQLGHALKLLGDRDGARASYVTAAKFGPDNQDALDEL